MRYLVLAREDLTNQVEGRALRNKTTAVVCKFLIEDVNCQYGCVGKIVADRGELDAKKAKELFDRVGVKLSLTTMYNLEANGKAERGHGPILNVIVRECEMSPNYAQFGDRIHAYGAHVRAETHHAGGANDYLLDDSRLG